MTVCAMYGCKNRMHKGSGKHFFRFPLKDPERLARWIEVVQRDDWRPTVHSKVCSDHFTEKDYMVRPGAACPYLRTDAVPVAVFTQRKKKTKKGCIKKSASVSAAADKTGGEIVGDDAQRENQNQQMEDMVTQDAQASSKEMPEAPQQGQTPASEPLCKEKAADIRDNEAEMDTVQEKGPEIQTQGSEPAAETQSQEHVEACGPSRTEEPESRWAKQSSADRMADIDSSITTQNERQVALILAELEDTHCEIRAAEARAAREAAASKYNQSPDESLADGATSSDNQSSSDNLTDYIPFDHAYTSLTFSDKENNIPAPIPAPACTPTPSPSTSPLPVMNPKIVKLRKKIKTIQKQVLRQGAKIKSLKQTLVELRRSNLSDKDPQRVIAEHCNGLALALFTTQLKNHRKYSSMQYCNLLKDFSMNLYHASPKAYKFCRLFLCLPHPVSLRHWKTVMESKEGEMILQSEDTQGEMSQEDILAGALQAVALESETSHDEALQNEAQQEEQTH